MLWCRSARKINNAKNNSVYSNSIVISYVYHDHYDCRIVLEFVKRDESTINDEDENSNTPLHQAAMAGHAKTVRALIDAGADIESR